MPFSHRNHSRHRLNTVTEVETPTPTPTERRAFQSQSLIKRSGGELILMIVESTTIWSCKGDTKIQYLLLSRWWCIERRNQRWWSWRYLHCCVLHQPWLWMRNKRGSCGLVKTASLRFYKWRICILRTARRRLVWMYSRVRSLVALISTPLPLSIAWFQLRSPTSSFSLVPFFPFLIHFPVSFD